MTDITPASQVALLTRPPAPAAVAPQLSSGSVSLFRDGDWSSQKLELRIADYAPGQRQTIPASMMDAATYVAFNLPIGTVMTLMDNIQPVLAGKSVADLSFCGRSVDLVGTGKTEAVDLMAANVNDCVSCFFWREVELTLGAIELFDDLNFAGNRNTVFLSEWNPGTLWPITDWWLNDKISSMRWKTLSDRQTAVLFENTDGSGAQYNNIKGWGDLKEVSNLPDVRFNDQASSFRWDAIAPVKEIIAPFPITAGSSSSSPGLTSIVEGTNDSSLPLPVTVTLTNTKAQNVTVSTTDKHVAGISSTLSLSATAEVPGMSATATFSVTVNYSYTHSETSTTSETKTVALSIAETINAPPHCSYKASLLVNIGTLPPTLYHTTAERWYTAPMTGAIADPLFNNWYKRIEPVTVSVGGSLASTTSVNMKSTPLRKVA